MYEASLCLLHVQVPIRSSSWTEDRRVSHGATMSACFGAKNFDPTWDEVYADASLSYLYFLFVACFCCQPHLLALLCSFRFVIRQSFRGHGSSYLHASCDAMLRGPSAGGCDPMRTLQWHLS